MSNLKLYISGYGVPSIGVLTIDNGNILDNRIIGNVENSSYLSVYGEYLFAISEL